MPSIPENRSNWDDARNWQQDGEEWSHSWGGTDSLWFGTILPRLAGVLPAVHLLEIACGHGRITERLLPHCERYTGVDLAPSCVAFCRQRFAGHHKATFGETDGRSLDAVADASVDVAFSWDSLVHAETDAVFGYLHALATKLRTGGVAFLHHSNVGAFVVDGKLTVENEHWRATSVSAAGVRETASKAGLVCLGQELVQWGAAFDNDCFSLLQRPAAASGPAPEPVLLRHPGFAAEIEHFRRLQSLYLATVSKPRRV